MTTGRGTGIRPDRIYTGTDEQAFEGERHDIRTSTPMPILRRAVVVDVFTDPIAQLDDETRERLRDDVRNPEVIDRISRGCIIGRIITADSDRHDQRGTIFFPLLAPYLTLPVKPGEQVFVLYEDPVISADVGFWISRIPEPNDVDDINYTHGDRRYVAPDVSRDTIDRLQQGHDSSIPGFPNGNPTDDSLTIGNSHDEYDKIVERASASKQVVFEPVPRFNHRPGDWVAHGSNNTLIALTTDRTGPAYNPDEVVDGAGTIYIVAGRGQSNATAPPTVENSRGHIENDKTPGLRDGQLNPREGDPDFANDLSTIIVSMKTNIDANFGINIPNGGEMSPGNRPAIALKTDQLRLIGRDDVKIQAGSNETGAAIVLRANGDIILIPGPSGVIKLGGDDADHAVLGNTGANSGGNVVGVPIMTSMGGVAGTPADDPHGKFASKILVTA